MKVSWVAYLAIAVALTSTRYDLAALAWGEYVMFGLLGLLLLWCFSGTRRGDDPAHHQRPNKSLAFALGKTLNRIRRGKSG